MSTLEQAAREALVALTESVDLVRTDYATDWRYGLQTRAAQLAEKRRGVDLHESAIAKLQAALGAGQAQAVAWVDQKTFDDLTKNHHGALAYQRWLAVAAPDPFSGRVIPLYAAPPAPAVPPLTDEQIDSICAPNRGQRWRNDGRQYDRDTTRLIERAHGIGLPAPSAAIAKEAE